MDDPPPSASNPPIDDSVIPYNVQAHLPPSPDISRNGDNYCMSNPRRGVAVIFNQKRFEGSLSVLPERESSEADVQCLSESFSRLGFDVETHTDSSLQVLKDILEELRGRDHSDCDCFALIFMTYGNEGGRLACRDQLFDSNLLWDMFTQESCPSLAYKPKLFFIPAGQGYKTHKAVQVGERTGEVEVPPEGSRLVLPSYSLPDQPDFLISLATTPGYCTSGYGSMYIQRLCTHLDLYGFREDLLSLLTGVARTVAIDSTRFNLLDNDYITQLPSLISFLTRALRFTDKNTSCKRTRGDLTTGDDEQRDGEESMKMFCGDKEHSTSTQT